VRDTVPLTNAFTNWTYKQQAIDLPTDQRNRANGQTITLYLSMSCQKCENQNKKHSTFSSSCTSFCRLGSMATPFLQQSMKKGRTVSSPPHRPTLIIRDYAPSTPVAGGSGSTLTLGL
jgi:hypothetical protein